MQGMRTLKYICISKAWDLQPEREYYLQAREKEVDTTAAGEVFIQHYLSAEKNCLETIFADVLTGASSFSSGEQRTARRVFGDVSMGFVGENKKAKGVFDDRSFRFRG